MKCICDDLLALKMTSLLNADKRVVRLLIRLPLVIRFLPKGTHAEHSCAGES
jgi:hypothetical protein